MKLITKGNFPVDLYPNTHSSFDSAKNDGVPCARVRGSNVGEGKFIIESYNLPEGIDSPDGLFDYSEAVNAAQEIMESCF